MIKEKEIREVAERIAMEYGPEEIILFGSFAWGNPTEDSDIDLLIIKDTKEDFFERNMSVRNIINGVLPADILVRTPKEVAKRIQLGDFFYKNIVTKGKKYMEDSQKILSEEWFAKANEDRSSSEAIWENAANAFESANKVQDFVLQKLEG